MPCALTVSLDPIMAGTKLEGLVVHGTVQFSGGAVCGDLNVRVTCDALSPAVSVFEQVSILLPAGDDLGTFSHQFKPLPAGFAQCCGGTLAVELGCPDCGNHTFQLPLNCGSTCPKLGHLIATPGPCKFDGTVDVVCTAPMTDLGTYAQVTMQWTVNGAPVGVPVVVSGAGPISTVLTLAGGGQSATVGLHYIDPAPPACPPLSVVVALPSCEVCPPIKITHAVGDCNLDGTRTATVTAVLTAAGSTQISAQMTGPFPTVSGTGTGSLTLTGVAQVNSGTFNVTVTAGSCPPQSYSFSLEDCCPTVAFAHVVKGVPICTAGETREVKVKAVVTPTGGVPTTAMLVDASSGAVLASGTGAAEFTLDGSGDYKAGTHYVQVVFGEPLHCPPRSYAFCTPKCESVKCFGFRASLLIAITTFLTISCLNGITAFAADLDAYTSGNYWYLFGRYLDYLGNTALQSALGNVQALALIAAIGFFLWWAFCIKFLGVQIGACCYSWCSLRLVLWQVPYMVGLSLLWFLACSWLLILVSAIVLFLIASLFQASWKKKCCPGTCDPLFYILNLLGLVVTVVYTIDYYTDLTDICIKTGLGSGNYKGWYINLLFYATGIVRLIILIQSTIHLLKWSLCLAKKP